MNVCAVSLAARYMGTVEKKDPEKILTGRTKVKAPFESVVVFSATPLLLGKPPCRHLSLGTISSMYETIGVGLIGVGVTLLLATAPCVTLPLIVKVVELLVGLEQLNRSGTIVSRITDGCL